jgi:5-methylcytosine-specific restriction endonuclease McrA
MDKRCSVCKEVKDTDTGFHRSKQSKDGYKPLCKKCKRLEQDRYVLARGGKLRYKGKVGEGEKYCTKCELPLPISDFHPKSSWCRGCRKTTQEEHSRKLGVPKKRKRNPEHIKQGLKECFKCNRVLPVGDFSPVARGYAGLACWCKDCSNGAAKEPKKRAALTASTREWRKDNESYRLQHRQHQQKRRASKQAGDDGTVTTQFMVELYATKTCYYCKKFVEPDKRTADHKTPISRRGLHSTNNLVMSCGRCNSSKGDRTEEEFKEYLCLKRR